LFLSCCTIRSVACVFVCVIICPSLAMSGPFSLAMVLHLWTEELPRPSK
jgi:hypothetical protein